jgi:hypothetical protein
MSRRSSKEDIMRIHSDVTIKRVIEAVQLANTTLDNPGFCIKCGAEADGVEPDAEGYECEACGSYHVYGAEQLLILGNYHK